MNSRCELMMIGSRAMVRGFLETPVGMWAMVEGIARAIVDNQVLKRHR